MYERENKMKIELTERQRAAKAEYLRRWRDQNREKVAEAERKRWDRYADLLDAEKADADKKKTQN